MQHIYWNINGTKISLSTDTFAIEINPTNFDTLTFFAPNFDYKSTALAKFKQNKYYVIRAIKCTDFDIVLDNEEYSQLHPIEFCMINGLLQDSMIGFGGLEHSSILTNKDSCAAINAHESYMCANTRLRIGMISKPIVEQAEFEDAYFDDSTYAFNFQFQFIENERLKITYDVGKKEFYLRLID